MKDVGADIGIMAFVLQFAPQEFVQDPEARHDPVPSVAAAEISRPELDQLADHHAARRKPG